MQFVECIDGQMIVLRQENSRILSSVLFENDKARNQFQQPCLVHLNLLLVMHVIELGEQCENGMPLKSPVPLADFQHTVYQIDSLVSEFQNNRNFDYALSSADNFLAMHAIVQVVQHGL